MARINIEDLMLLQRDVSGSGTYSTYHYKGQDLIELVTEQVDSSKISVSTIPPLGADNGDLWFNSTEDNLQLFMFYKPDNLEAGVWIPTTPAFGGEFAPVNYSNLPLLEKY